MKRLRALYVADRWDAPYRYRCLHACEQLRRDGVVANVAHLGDRKLLQELEQYSVIVLFRLPWGPDVEAIVDGARRAGIPLVFDVDDLVFDPDIEPLFPFRTQYSDAEWEAAYGRQLRALRGTFDACDLFVGSTPALAEHAARLGKPARVHPNVAPSLYVSIGRRLARFDRLIRSQPTLGYFSGSDTHDADFRSIAEPLRRALAADRNRRLLIGGYVDVADQLAGFEDRVVRVPYLSWQALPFAFRRCDVVLAPLTARNTFTDAKSALKFFEAGAVGVPAIATPVREMRGAIEHGTNGWLADSTAQWTAALEAALDRTTSRDVGERAQEATLRDHSQDGVRGLLRALLETVAVEASGAEPRATPLAGDEFLRTRGVAGQAVAAIRAGGDVGRLVRALVERRPAPPERAAVERWLSAVRSGTSDPALGGATLLVSGSPEASGWRHNAELTKNDALPGEALVIGSDPWWTSPRLDLDQRCRFMVLTMRASAAARRGTARLYWASRPGDWRESKSVAFSVNADGVDHSYLVDLGSAGVGGRQRALFFRFDPLDRPGSVRLSTLALLPAEWSAPEVPGASRATVADRSLPVRPPAARRMLKRSLGVLEPPGDLALVASGTADELRALLTPLLIEHDAELDELASIDADRLRAVIRKPERPKRPGVDVVIPVYGAPQATLRCVKSVLEHAKGDVRVVVIDDSSPDRALVVELKRLAGGRKDVIVLENERNLGFVATANLGFSHAGERDVLLLNSDTEVYAGFVDCLQQAAYADSKTGIVCPLSNNATICSVPEFCRPNELPKGMSGDEMARLIKSSSLRLRPELVTPVGFCMYVRHSLLREIGTFDAASFGRGFGEENDFGERAKRAGYRIRLADDVFVYHEGKASFGDEGRVLEANNARVLERRQPGYHAAVAHFVRENPLAPVQAQVKWALRRNPHARQPAALFIVHASPFSDAPGGAEHVVLDLLRGLALSRAVVAYPSPRGIEAVEVLDGDVDGRHTYEFALTTKVPRFSHQHADAERALDELISDFRIGFTHVHHAMFWPLSLERVLARRKLPYVVTVHDFYGICPSHNLLDLRTTTRCCPESCGDAARTAGCLRALFERVGEPLPADPALFAAEHRRLFAELFGNARRVVFPSPSAQDIVARFHRLDARQTLVIAHGNDPPKVARSRERRSGPLRVALLGEIAYLHKGAELYIETLRSLSDVPIEWHVFGPTDRFGFDARLSATGARVVRYGPYRREDAVRLLLEADVDVGLVLPAWPETWSLTTSELLAAGVPVVAASQGALVDRLTDKPFAVLIGGAAEAKAVLERLSRQPSELSKLRASAATYEPVDRIGWLDAHRALYADCALQLPRASRAPESDAQIARLARARIATAMTSAVNAVTQPASRFTSRWWFPHAERAKPYVPEAIRALARRLLADDGLITVESFRLAPARVKLGGDLRLERRYLATACYDATGPDPHLYIEGLALEPKDVQLARFNMWCSTSASAFAKLYWLHENDTAFGEDRSASVALNGAASAWQEYVLDLDRGSHAAAWHGGGRIVALRFDPIDLPGPICLGKMALCKRASG